MDITKEIDQDGIPELVLRLPLDQMSYDAVGEPIGDVNNLVGVIAGDSYSISQSIDMSYKGKDAQEGMPIIMFDSREELEEVCKRIGLDIWEYPLCAYCKGAIRGSFTLGDKGNMCWDCDRALTKEKEGVL